MQYNTVYLRCAYTLFMDAYTYILTHTTYKTINDWSMAVLQTLPSVKGMRLCVGIRVDFDYICNIFCIINSNKMAKWK